MNRRQGTGHHGKDANGSGYGDDGKKVQSVRPSSRVTPRPDQLVAKPDARQQLGNRLYDLDSKRFGVKTSRNIISPRPPFSVRDDRQMASGSPRSGSFRNRHTRTQEQCNAKELTAKTIDTGEEGRVASGNEESELKHQYEDEPGISLRLARQRRFKLNLKSFTETIMEREPDCANMMDPDFFRYFTIAPGGSAYDLIPVNKPIGSSTTEDVFVVSSTGITTHYSDGDTEFIAMDLFEREFCLFSNIKEITFFHQFRLWKSFMGWKKNIRTKKFEYCKTRLQENLFILHPLLHSSLLGLRKLCYEASSFKLFSIQGNKTYELDEFAEAQKTQRDIARVHLESFSSEVRHLLLRACDSVLRGFLERNGFAWKYSKPARENSGNDDPEDQPRAITFTERAAMRTQCRKLTKYIRLIDFLVVDTFLAMATSSTSTLLSNISSRQLAYITSDGPTKARTTVESIHSDLKAITEGGDRNKKTVKRDSLVVANSAQHTRKEVTTKADEKAIYRKRKMEDLLRPIFVVKMDSHMHSLMDSSDDDSESDGTNDDRDLGFYPTAEDFRVEIETMIFDALKVVTDPERLLTHPAFSLYVQPSMEDSSTGHGERMDMEMMIVEDPYFQKMVDDITEALRLGFENATEHCELFAPFIKQYIRNERLVRKLEVQYYENATIDVFQEMLSKYTAQQQLFELVPTISDIGIVRIDSNTLKELFVPSPKRCLNKIKDLVPEILRLKTNETLSEMRHKNERLRQVAYSVDDFVDQLAFLRDVCEHMDELDQRFFFVMQLNNLCNEFKVSLKDEEKTTVYMLKETNKALHGTIHLSEGSINDNTARFAKELEEQIPRLRTRAGSARTMLGNVMIFSPDSDSLEVIQYLDKLQTEVDKIHDLRKRYIYYQKTLGLPQSTFDEIDEIQADLRIKSKLWNALYSWDDVSVAWGNMVFCDVNAGSILHEVDQYLKIAVQAERSLPGNFVAPMLKEKVLNFKRTLPVVTALRCGDLKERHWDRIHKILGYRVNGVHDLTLSQLIERRAMHFCEDLETISTEAVQEAVLVALLENVIEQWDHADFTIVPYKDTKENVLGGVDDIIIDLDDSLVTINTILGSRYVKYIRETVDEFHQKLVLMQETLEEWLVCQRNWMYLESIFSAPDIQRQLPLESKLFAKIDSSFKENMRRAGDDPNCIKCCTRNGLKETLQKHNSALEKIQKSLEDYLETKRAAFARFYFLSNDELLEILAQTKEPQAVQPHLRKCFDALVELDFGDQPKSIDIKAMLSPEGERIELGKNLKARGNVEDWLTAVETNMKVSLQKLMKAGLIDYFEKQRVDWVRSHPGQIVATVAQIAWVIGTEAVLNNQSVSEGDGFVEQYFGEAISSLDAWYEKNVVELETLTELVRSDLSKRERKIIVALVTTDVHARDIIETLRNDNVSSVDNFVWQQQLRYYWHKEDIDDCIVRQSNSEIRYAYEYEGCTSRLVITPLTDRCWMTLTGALHLKLGGSPSGPAGTGKTESSKDLAKALGIQCIVFNCSDQIDYKMMAKLFSGLAQAGCWTCLDEFNRIDIEVLSVIAQQLLTLRQGRLSNQETIAFEGRKIYLRDHHVIITMNPGYAGRTELPDNLKVLFRPVAMMVPDYSLIAEIMLFAEGFGDAKTLSRKMTKMYMLCSEQLSQQCHYDYGLRAVKSVLVMAGGLKRGNPNLPEDVVLIRAMRDSNLPKFLSQDVPLFFGILTDLFPGVVVPYQDTGELQVAIEDVLKKQSLQIVAPFVKKIIQLYETLQVRFGVTIVGPTGAAKTTAYNTLSSALTNLHRDGLSNPKSIYLPVVKTVLSPKCITMGELYGEFNLLTQEWTDGLASSIMRACVSSVVKESQWIIFDGPIDALWIENMNTVLDDNMTLCLANGERIKLKATMKCLFEVQDLEVASPATVSRLGVLYMTPNDLGWIPYIETWSASVMKPLLPASIGEKVLARVMTLVNKVLTSGIAFLRQECEEPIPTCDIQIASSFCSIFQALFTSSPYLSSIRKKVVSDASGSSNGGTEQNDKNSEPLVDDGIDEERVLALADKLFVFSCIWSIGAGIDASYREAFDEWARREFDRSGLSRLGFSVKGLVYDYFVDMLSEEFCRWEEVLPAFQYEKTDSFSQLVVPTIDTVRYSFVIEKLLELKKPCFLTGVTGTGKTILLQKLLRDCSAPAGESIVEAKLGSGDDDDAAESKANKAKNESSARALEIHQRLGCNQSRHIVPVHIGFSAQTSAKVTQLSIEAKLEKKRKALLGAPSGQSVVICVDDVNMPTVEEYGAQPPIELLRQFLDFSGFYDREKLFFKEIQDTVLTVVAAPPGGGRNVVTPRFVRHFNMLCLPPTSRSTMQVMFQGILSGYLSFGFPLEVKQLALTVVQSTIDVYSAISKEMLPTPQKSHYTFNLRDVSKVIQGILMIQNNRCTSVPTMVRLWAHECMRVFHDRLINTEDKSWFSELLVNLLKKNFQLNWTTEELFGSTTLENDSGNEARKKSVRSKVHPPLMFVDFLRGIADDNTGEGQEDADQENAVETRPYEEIDHYEQVTRVLENALEDYNLVHPTTMNLVFFRDALEHVARITRILRQKRGNAMLVGVGGSGKQSLSRLSGYICGMQCVQIEITKGYGGSEFREDIKLMMIQAGVGGEKVLFLFTDTQIIVDDFLEDINNILNSGEIPNLFPQEEMDKILSDMAPVLKKKRIVETRDNCKQAFVNRVRDNLHIILCMSPVGKSLRVWCRQFPSLINCCTIDWFLEWPQSALNSVAKRFLSKLSLPSEECREALVSACAMVHRSIGKYADDFHQKLGRNVYTTPKSYLDLIELYISLLDENRAKMNGSCDRLSNGIVKLEETNEMVLQLKGELNKLMPVLELKSQDAEILLKQVATEQAEASQVKAKVATEEAEVNAKAEEVSEIQEDAQKDLEKAMPALNDAIKSLDALDKKDITEIKNFIKPPAAVQTVMEAVNVLLGEKADWDTAKKVMSDHKFMENLKNFDKDNISAGILKKLKKYVEDPIMSVENVKKVSKAATSLCMWVHAMDVYSEVAKEVEPKRERLQRMNEALADANAILAEKQAALQEVVDKVNTLQATCEETLSEKNRLAKEAQNTRARLERAEKLTSGLASEGIRWKESVEQSAEEIKYLVGDMFLASACVSYYGSFTGAYREKLLNSWLSEVKSAGIPCSNTFSLVKVIGDPVLVREWQIFGLPTDEISTNNAILATRGKRWPLMIDPQMQANRWIKQKESRNGIECVKMTDPSMLRSLEAAVRNGKPLLLQDLGEHIDPALEPILQKAVFRQKGRNLIRIGDSDVDYDDNFKLYMTTKMPNPHYLPEVCIKVTLINFTVTMDGLEDQLLGTVVRKEKPDIEERKNRLLLSMAADQKQLKDIEDKILRMLSESKGDILDDEELINTLADSKTTSAIITERVQESKKTNIEVNLMRNSYRPVATRGSIVYFVVADLAKIDPMYQYSLEYFVKLFKKCIDDSCQDDSLPRRLDNILRFLNSFVYKNVCRGLFEKHKLHFSFLLTVHVLRNAGSISDTEWGLFLRGATTQVHLPSSIPEKYATTWNMLCTLEAELPETFSGLTSHVVANWQGSGGWLEWATSLQIHQTALPAFESTFEGDEENDEDKCMTCKAISQFQRLLLIRAFREEKSVFAIRSFVCAELGPEFAENVTASMEDVCADMDNKTPCIFVLSQGADPTGILLRYAEKEGYRERLNVISLGQGQGPKAEHLISNATRNGDWVLLQNCHLAKSWMPKLEMIIAGFAEMQSNQPGGSGGEAGSAKPQQPQTINESFRLFLTSFPASYFPVSVLQNGLKLTNEPPKGLRANIFRSFDKILPSEVFDSCVNKPRAFQKLLFGLCFFHGVIQERRKFGPLGWNIRYEFDDSDLETSAEQLCRFLTDSGDGEIPWDALRYVTGQINYGGRVTDDWDRRCLMSVLGRFYTPRMLDEGYCFSPSGSYYAPEDLSNMENCKAYVSSLPGNEDPEVFGMHDNANITYELKESTAMIDTILSIEPRSGSSGMGGSSVDQVVSELATSMDKELPAILDAKKEAGAKTFVLNKETGLFDPLATFLQQEIIKFNRLLGRIKSTIRQLLDAIKGIVVMSGDLEKMYNSFFNNTVPGLWASVAYPSLRPLSSWFEDLKVRVSFIRSWLQLGEPTVFPLPVFFFPQGFMTGILQTHARKYQVPVNSLGFDFEVYHCDAMDIDEKPSNGVIVCGLYMEGAQWNFSKDCLEDSLPGEMYSPMRPIHFLPTENFKPDPTMYACPVYKTSTRAGTLSTTGMSTNFVLPIYLPTDKDPEYWVWKGVAFLCNLND